MVLVWLGVVAVFPWWSGSVWLAVRLVVGFALSSPGSLLLLCDGFCGILAVAAVAYARISTEDQDTRLQREALREAD